LTAGTKPDPAIFRLLLLRFGLTASRCVFIDDTLKNVEAARLLGFHAIRFSNAPQLGRDLARLGLMPAQPERLY
jgi:2-haloacid dehalogenase